MKIITIDGPAGAGKSTVAKELARRLNFSFLDTGAMYRALTLKALREEVNLEDESALVALARRTSIDLLNEGSKPLQVLLDGQDVSVEIRSPEVTNKTFYIARTPEVRNIMVQWQRDIGARRNVVVEGRDTGTVVFPNASYKFYLDADFEERTRRRLKELAEQGKMIEAEELKRDLEQRDQKDMTRSVGPLKKAEDAIFIDSTNMTVDQSVDKILEYIQ